MDGRHKVELFEEIRCGYATGETIKGLAKNELGCSLEQLDT
jgi:hypothetical protein